MTKGADGFFVDQRGQKPSFELRTTGDNDARRKTLFSVADFWQKVGVTVDAQIVPEQLQGDRQYRAEFPAFEIKRSSSDLTELPRFHSTQARTAQNGYRGAGGSLTNDPRYASPELDALSDRFVSTIPIDQRLQIAGQMIRHITESLVILGLYFDTEPTMVSNRLRNFNGEVWNAHEWDIGN
jgi:ABC-type transport system substrate-binding protein